MSITIPALSSPNLSFKHHVPFAKVAPISHLLVRTRHLIISSRSLPTKIQVFNPQCRWNFIGSSGKLPRFSLGRHLGVSVNARDNEGGQNNGVSGSADVGLDQAEKEARAQSTMPERFRYLTREAPDHPVRWPWFVGQSFCLTLLSSLCAYACVCVLVNEENA